MPLSQTANGLDTPMFLMHSDGIPLFSYRLFDPYSTNVTNVVSTRLGGVSEVPYDSLNLSLSSPDSKESVLENRRLLASAIHVDLSQLMIAQLIQGTHIEAVTQEIVALNSSERIEALQGTDGLLTNIPEVALAVLIADCTAVTFFDPYRKAIAIAHSGWRGTAGNIVTKMVQTMNKTYGCDPADILVGMSPNMSGDTFQVRSDVLAIFRSHFGEEVDRFFRYQDDDGSYRLDLNDLLLWQLHGCGIHEDHIEVAGIDTAARTDLFYSHRAERGKTGRFCGLIVLRQE